MLPAPVYAQFVHPDGSWYRLWITYSVPKTERGHPWHLHASYDKTGTIAPVQGQRWYELEYGMANWDYQTRDEASADFRKRANERLRHGYQLQEGALAEAFPPEAMGKEEMNAETKSASAPNKKTDPP